LEPHSDGVKRRRLMFVVYLSLAWKIDYGGAMHIVGRNDVCSKIKATFNSLAVFDSATQNPHYVVDI